MGSVMTEENTATQEFVDNSPEAIADREESAKIEAAQAELDAEQAEADGLILGKYESTEDLAAAYQNLQRELQRVKDGSADQGQSTPEPVAEPEAEPEASADSGDALNPEQLAAITNSLYEQAGGEQQYATLTAWAKDNCSEHKLCYTRLTSWAYRRAPPKANTVPQTPIYSSLRHLTRLSWDALS